MLILVSENIYLGNCHNHSIFSYQGDGDSFLLCPLSPYNPTLFCKCGLSWLIIPRLQTFLGGLGMMHLLSLSSSN